MTTTPTRAKIGHMTGPTYLDTAAQAARIGVTRTHLSRLRTAHRGGTAYRDHPMCPEYPPDVITGHVTAEALDEWNAARICRGSGRRRTRPEGLTVREWSNLVALARGEDVGVVWRPLAESLAAKELVRIASSAPAVRITQTGADLVAKWTGQRVHSAV